MHTFQKVIWLLTMFLRRYAYRCHTALNAVQRWEVNQMEDKAHWENTDETVWDARNKDSGEEFEISIATAKCSVCGKWAEQVNAFPPYMHYEYCPHCSRKMDAH